MLVAMRFIKHRLHFFNRHLIQPYSLVNKKPRSAGLYNICQQFYQAVFFTLPVCSLQSLRVICVVAPLQVGHMPGLSPVAFTQCWQ